MAWFGLRKNKTPTAVISRSDKADVGFFLPKNKGVEIAQQFKGEVERFVERTKKELGEQHPFDFDVMENIYTDVGLVTGVIDKYVDFVIGPGFYAVAETSRAQQIIDQFIMDTGMDSVMRSWLKEALIKGNAFLELGGSKNDTVKGMKVLDASHMYIKRDNKGKVEKYNQYTGHFNEGAYDKRRKIIEFQPFQIAHLAINQLPGKAYGIGIIRPSYKSLNNLLDAQTSMHTILRRKANSPMHVKIGTAEAPVDPDVVTQIGQDLENLNDKHEWATGYDVDITAVNFGNVADKFDFPLNYNLDMLFFGYQTPEVLMGRGSIPEGLAQVQMEAFQLRTKSIQVEMEKIIEEKIFKRVLNSQGINEHVELEWGQPSDKEKNERITKLSTLLQNPLISVEMRVMLEEELAILLGFPPESLMSAEQRKKEFEGKENPPVPGENNKQRQSDAKKIVQHAHKQQDIYTQAFKDTGEYKDYNVRQWLDFNYQEYLAFILAAVRKDKFTLLAATSQAELKLGKLSGKQIGELKGVLSTAYKENKSLVAIAEEIKTKVKPGDLINAKGKLLSKEESRSMLIARTETTRMASIGAEEHFKDKGVKQYQWVSTISDRTSDICMSLNGQVFQIGKGPKPPAHINCRSTILPLN